MFEHKRIGLMVHLVLGKPGILLHGGGSGGVNFEWGGGTLPFGGLHLEHVRVALAQRVHHASPPEKNDLPLRIGKMAEVFGIVAALIALVMKVMLQHPRIGVDVVRLGIKYGSEKHGTGKVGILCLLVQLLLRELAHLLHTNKVVAQLRIVLHGFGGKTVLCPTEAVEVGVRAAEGSIPTEPFTTFAQT